MMATPITAGVEFEAGVPQPLFRTGLTAVNHFREQYRNSPDGRRFLVKLPVEQGIAPPITVVVNWMNAITK